MRDEASFTIVVTTLLIAKYVKSKMTRECTLGQIDFFDVKYKYTASLLVKEQFQEGIPQVMHSPKLDAVETDEEGFPLLFPEEQSGCAGKMRSESPMTQGRTCRDHLKAEKSSATT